jgi:acetylornithine deacetylase/succinyl-diaminopimelate desuccinylase-like protein
MTITFQTYLTEHKDRFLDQLKEFVSIPSISTLTDHKADVLEAANWLANALIRAGLENVQIIPTVGNPIVYGD